MTLPIQAQGTAVSLQIVNPDEGTVVRVFLDRRLVYEGSPDKASLAMHGESSAAAGSFALQDRQRHVLVAEAPATRTKARLEWTPQRDPGSWIVIRYYPGRSEPGEPPFFTFSLQAAPYRLK